MLYVWHFVLLTPESKQVHGECGWLGSSQHGDTETVGHSSEAQPQAYISRTSPPVLYRSAAHRLSERIGSLELET